MLKTFAAFLSLLFLSTLWVSAQSKKTEKISESKKGTEAYKFDVKIKGVKDTICFLAYHMGDKQYIADTAKVDGNGNMTFSGAETLDPGIYMVVLPNRKYFEVIVNEQKFSIETDTARLNEDLNFKGSKENTVFLDYIRFVSVKGQEINDLATKYKAAKDNKDETERLRKEIKTREDAIADYRKKLSEENKGTLIANILKALTDPKRPEPPLASNGRPDSAWRFYDARAHYFDNIDFSDARLLRTPILLSKVKYFLESLTVGEPDSINKSADFILDKTLANKEVFRYFLWYISNTYETSKFMGMDAVFVHVAKKYYLSGKADWVDSTTLRKIGDRVRILDPLLLDKVSPRLFMRDTLNRPVSLHEVAAKNKFTILIFYDPNCGHCQKEVPEINDKFYKTYKAKGVEVIAACAERNPNDWRKFVRKHKLSFINVFDADTVVDFRNVWDVYSFPVIYVLDQNKKIIGKRVPSEDLAKFIDETEKIRRRMEADKQKTGTGKK
jgi:thiol-disulfide isomerase/thioredoxin